MKGVIGVMASMKPLLPTLREKKRYVAFEVASQSSLKSFQDVARGLWNGFLTFLGELEAGKAGINIIANTYDAEKQRGLIRVNNKYVDSVKAALLFITSIDQQPVMVRSLGVSGVLNKAQKKYI